MSSSLLRFVMLLALVFVAIPALAQEGPRRIPLRLAAEDVIPTGNEWLSLPTIRASDAALVNFNVLSMRQRGLLQVQGDAEQPVLQPYLTVEGKDLPLKGLTWEVLEYWIPAARFDADGLELEMTYCAPPGFRAAFIRLKLTNHRQRATPVILGMKASWGSLARVTYTPVAQRGERSVSEAPWVSPGEAFSFVTYDTQFAWALVHPDAQAKVVLPPLSTSPTVNAERTATVAPGQSVEANFILAAGVEEFSAAHNARSLREMIDRYGSEAMIARAAQWCRERTRTTGRADLDLLMNRNLLFTALFAWGKTIDTEQLVGVTSRSPRYYVSAAYWDRDAMLWSFPGLLDVDTALARDALEYAFTTQLRDTGTHSRFIDGIVLEDGFQLDEAVAPIIALGQYQTRTHDVAFVSTYRSAIAVLERRVLGRFDAATGLYSTLQDSQDEFQKLPFITYGNVLTWRALIELSNLHGVLKDVAGESELRRRADALKQAILKHCVATGAPGASGPIFASATDGSAHVFTDIPPGSLLKLPALGFVPETDPVFASTYQWLHSPNYQYAYASQPYGFPGSYRLPFTTSWTIADELRLQRGREKALSTLLKSPWDGGIVTEGVSPSTAVADTAGRAFATAAGYVAHAICDIYCTDKQRPISH